MIGAYRTWRAQNAIVRGKAITGGFEIALLAAGVFIVSRIALLGVMQDNGPGLTSMVDFAALLCPPDRG